MLVNVQNASFAARQTFFWSAIIEYIDLQPIRCSWGVVWKREREAKNKIISRTNMSEIVYSRVFKHWLFVMLKVSKLIRHGCKGNKRHQSPLVWWNKCILLQFKENKYPPLVKMQLFIVCSNSDTVTGDGTVTHFLFRPTRMPGTSCECGPHCDTSIHNGLLSLFWVWNGMLVA